MTMLIEVKNQDDTRVCEITEDEYLPGKPTPEMTHKHSLRPGESRGFYIHAAKVLTVRENPNG